jgi:hypothetical protein
VIVVARIAHSQLPPAGLADDMPAAGPGCGTITPNDAPSAAAAATASKRPRTRFVQLANPQFNTGPSLPGSQLCLGRAIT